MLINSHVFTVNIFHFNYLVLTNKCLYFERFSIYNKQTFYILSYLIPETKVIYLTHLVPTTNDLYFDSFSPHNFLIYRKVHVKFFFSKTIYMYKIFVF